MGDVEPFDPEELHEGEFDDASGTFDSVSNDYVSAISQPGGVTPELEAQFKAQMRTGFEQYLRGAGVDPTTVDLDAFVDDIYDESMADHQPGEPYSFPTDIVGKYPAIDEIMNRSYATIYESFLDVGEQNEFFDKDAVKEGNTEEVRKAEELARKMIACTGSEIAVVGGRILLRPLPPGVPPCDSKVEKAVQDLEQDVGKKETPSNRTRNVTIAAVIVLAILTAGSFVTTWAVLTQKAMDSQTGCYYIDTSKGIQQQVTGGGTDQCQCCGGSDGPFHCTNGACCGQVACEPTGECVCQVPPPSIAPGWLSSLLSNIAIGVEWGILAIIIVIVAIIIIWLVLFAVRRFRRKSSSE